jgi:hypothetical protein
MKKISIFIIFVLFVFSISSSPLGAHSGGEDQDKALLLSLTDKESQISMFNGIYFDFTVYKENKSFLLVSFENVNRSSGLSDSKVLLIASSKVSTKNRNATLAKLADFKDIKFSDFKVKTKGSLVQFDFYDSRGRLRTSEWRDKSNGFRLKSALYDEQGNLIGFGFFKKLKINQPARFQWDRKPIRIDGHIFEKNLSHFEIEDIEEDCEKIMGLHISKN